MFLLDGICEFCYDNCCVNFYLSQSELRLPLLQVVSSNKYFSVGVQSPTEINAPRGCAEFFGEEYNQHIYGKNRVKVRRYANDVQGILEMRPGV